ncbi:MAG: hypothetical protein GY894_11635 [Planctomycetes bacterium]|nr:hypothetical protein [Planctomycetota bacterium]MCP4839989.1 hypothetical protein [Planctomycetota bacterium]
MNCILNLPKICSVGLVMLICGSSSLQGGAFSVLVSESPLLYIEGIATPVGDGTATVDFAWVLDTSPSGVGWLPLNTRPGEPHVDMVLYMICDVDPITDMCDTYTKFGVLDVLNVNYPDSPVPNGLSFMAATAPGTAGGWSWSGLLWADETDILDTIGGAGPPSASSPGCETPADTLDETRQLIELGNGLWLLIIVRDGQVIMLVYQYDPESGCWSFGYSPSMPGGPGPGDAEPWWGGPVDHTLSESLVRVWHYLIRQVGDNGLVEWPDGPIGTPGG